MIFSRKDGELVYVMLQCDVCGNKEELVRELKGGIKENIVTAQILRAFRKRGKGRWLSDGYGERCIDCRAYSLGVPRGRSK